TPAGAATGRDSCSTSCPRPTASPASAGVSSSTSRRGESDTVRGEPTRIARRFPAARPDPLGLGADMEGTVDRVPVLTYLAELATAGSFTLIDIGCSGGIDSVWRELGPRLHAVGIDPNVAEMERLRKAETHPGVHYVTGFAGLPPDHPLAGKAGESMLPLVDTDGETVHDRNPWPRLSTAKWLQLSNLRASSTSERMEANLWTELELADASEVIVVPDYLRAHGIDSVDFVKIDVDGNDFQILTSFDTALDAFGILGVGIEVNFFGSARATDHTLHNIDRFMKARGYELFNLTTRRYSVAALPSTYLYGSPWQTTRGRVVQGDALYARDLAS